MCGVLHFFIFLFNLFIVGIKVLVDIFLDLLLRFELGEGAGLGFIKWNVLSAIADIFHN